MNATIAIATTTVKKGKTGMNQNGEHNIVQHTRAGSTITITSRRHCDTGTDKS